MSNDIIFFFRFAFEQKQLWLDYMMMWLHYMMMWLDYMMMWHYSSGLPSSKSSCHGTSTTSSVTSPLCCTRASYTTSMVTCSLRSHHHTHMSHHHTHYLHGHVLSQVAIFDVLGTLDDTLMAINVYDDVTYVYDDVTYVYDDVTYRWRFSTC